MATVAAAIGPALASLSMTFGASLGVAPAHAAAPPTPTASEPPLTAPGQPLALVPCTLPGLEHAARCGRLARPLDPARPAGPSIELHVAVLPAMARLPQPDPVVMLAGGPGQSAIGLAPQAQALFGRLLNRRSVVLVDVRGTGRSAPLRCEEPPLTAALAPAVDPAQALVRLKDCREALQRLPHGDLRFYTTTLAMQDLDAVREALGVAQWNLVGGSYGTRAALEYARLFPDRVRRMVLDGMAPPDMVLPASFSPDGQAALDAVLTACEADAVCAARHPTLRDRWRALLASLPREVTVTHPLTGTSERLTLTRDTLTAQVRGALYVPATAAVLPAALERATQGDIGPLVAMSLAMASRRETALALGLHLSVVCAEDLPRLAQATDRPGADFGTQYLDFYTRACAEWPRGTVDEAFYRIPPLAAPVLALSGGADPATPPRHGERVVKALGPAARHVVVPQAGHGVMGLPCMRDVLFRFISAPTAEAAAAVATDCAAALPRPPAAAPVSAPSAARAAAASASGVPR